MDGHVHITNREEKGDSEQLRFNCSLSPFSNKGVNLPFADLLIGACALELGYAIGTDFPRPYIDRRLSSKPVKRL